MQKTADVVILGPAGERVAVIEVLNRQDLSPEHGADRQAYMRLTGGIAKYFLLVSQDVGYVWTDQTPGALPVAKFWMAPVIRRFLPNLPSGERLYGFQVEAFVSHWLFELASGWRAATEAPENSLAAIGFLHAVQGGRIFSEAAA